MAEALNKFTGNFKFSPRLHYSAFLLLGKMASPTTAFLTWVLKIVVLAKLIFDHTTPRWRQTTRLEVESGETDKKTVRVHYVTLMMYLCGAIRNMTMIETC